jgi:adenosylmethionine-8-amino-7-oxononanoate aminotransferase
LLKKWLEPTVRDLYQFLPASRKTAMINNMSSPHQTNAEFLARSLSAVWHPCSQMKHYERFPLLPIVRGSGVWLYDQEGKAYLDAVSSWWVNLFGHCNPRINAALREQLDTLEHVMLAGFTHEPVVMLSERLRSLAPTGLGHCFYASDGASATEIALKMSAHYWRNSGKPDKVQFISLQNSYHGETLGALSVTDVALFRDAYGALIRQQDTVPSPDWRKADAGESAESYALRSSEALERHLQQHHSRIAAFIIEPLVQCAAGMAMYHPIYLQRARQLCSEYGVHLIADEIAVGMGRTGTLFACEQAPTQQHTDNANSTVVERGITPDFLCLSKGITGGYLPLSVVMTRDEIYQSFYADEIARGFLHSHSYTGNPLACRAALATLDIFAQDRVLTANLEKAANMNEIARPLQEHGMVRNWRNTGMIWAFEVDTPHRDFTQRCFAIALKKGLLLRPIGNTVYFMPPYVISREEIVLLVESSLEVIELSGK